MVPLSSFYVREYSDRSLVQAGSLSGTLIGAYFVGRALTGWLWIAAGKSLGYRPIFTLAIMIETILTFLLGISTSVWTCIILRAASGMFSPLSALSLLVIKHLTAGFGEDIPVVAQTVAFVASAGQATGFLIGGCLSYPLENEIVDKSSLFSSEPYLLPTIVVGTLQFIALLFFFLDFPDLCEKTEDTKAAQKRDVKENSTVGKYAELSESSGTGQTELQRSEGAVILSENQDQGSPVTERKEREVEDNEEDLPAYLQCYELEVAEEYPNAGEDGGQAARSQRSAKVATPLGSTRALPEAKKPNSARNHVVAKLISHEERKESIDETEKGFRLLNRSEKTTHISFIEENFQNGSRSQQCQSLEDVFKRMPDCGWRPLCWSLPMLVLSNLTASWLEGSMVVWMPAVGEDGLSLLLVGVTLAGSVVGLWFLMWTFTLMCKYIQLYWAALLHFLLLLVAAGMPILLTKYRPDGVLWVLVVIALQFSLKYLATFQASFAELLVSDAMEPKSRQQWLLYGETVSVLFKGLGYAGGTFLFAYGESSPRWSGWGLNFQAAGGMGVLCVLLAVCGRKHFPRFQASPYAM